LNVLRRASIALALAGTIGLVVCALSWPHVSTKWWLRARPWVFAYLAFAVLFTAALVLARVRDGREHLAYRVWCLLLAQMALYGFFWGSLALEELLGVPHTTGHAFFSRVNRVAMFFLPVVELALVLGPLLIPGILRSLKRAQLLAALQVAGCGLAVIRYLVSGGAP
jgi:hypothetical protein